MRQSSFSSRLASKLNNLYRKIHDRRIEFSGILTDVIRVKTEQNTTGDITSREVIGLDLINVIFPRMEDVPMRKITSDSGTTRNAIYANEKQPFLLYAPTDVLVDYNDILVKLYEDTTADEMPWVTSLIVKDMLGTFGDRGIVWQRIQCSYFDDTLPAQIITYVTRMYERRETGGENLGW